MILNGIKAVDANLAYQKAYTAFCANGTILQGNKISYCDGHPFKCSGTYCTWIKSMAEDTYQCGKYQCTEEIPIG